MRNLFILSLILIVLFSGCIGERTTITETKYVCNDGSVVSNPVMCPRTGSEKVIVMRYVCPDGKVVDSPDMCSKTAELGTTTTCRQVDHQYGVFRYAQYPLLNSGRTGIQAELGTTTTFRKVDHQYGVFRYAQYPLLNSSREGIPVELGTTTTIRGESTQKATTTTVAELGTTTTSSTSTTSTIISEITRSCVELGCPMGTKFVGSKNSDKYHYCTCRYAKRIKPENLLCFSDEKDAQGQGYSPCGVCKPPE